MVTKLHHAERLQGYTVRRIDNAMSCHHTGYDRNDIQEARKKKEEKKKKRKQRKEGRKRAKRKKEKKKVILSYNPRRGCGRHLPGT